MSLPPAVLIYDGDCAFCRAGVEWIRRRARPGAFEYLPCRSDERRRRYPEMEDETCMSAMQLVLPDGRTAAAEKAVLEVLRRIRGWRTLTWIYWMPGAKRIAATAYAAFARNRYRLSCGAACRLPGGHPGPEKGLNPPPSR